MIRVILRRRGFPMWIATAMAFPSYAATFTYTYDSLSRLTNAAYSDGSAESYSYDPAGNRLSRVTSAATTNIDTTAPSIPVSLVTNTFTPSQISISWARSFDTGGSGLAGYNVFLNGILIATATDTSFLLTGLEPGAQYCLSVAAYDHNGNFSAESTNLCVATPIFSPPFLVPLGFSSSRFQLGIIGGTPGPYELSFSTNLVDWQPWTILVLPTSSNIFDPVAMGFQERFYRLRWSTNTP